MLSEWLRKKGQSENGSKVNRDMKRKIERQREREVGKE